MLQVDKLDELAAQVLTLLVQKYLLTGTKVQILSSRICSQVDKLDELAAQVLTCFTGTKVLAYWYKSANTDT
jgi:hypothetical protein